MRDINFKVWSILKKKMYDLDFYLDLEGTLFQSDDLDYRSKDYYKIMQFTGLKDKNGNEIFEGFYLKDDENFIWEVVFKDGAYCIENPDLMGREFLFLRCEFCEIVGNIYENEYKGDGILKKVTN